MQAIWKARMQAAGRNRALIQPKLLHGLGGIREAKTFRMRLQSIVLMCVFCNSVRLPHQAIYKDATSSHPSPLPQCNPGACYTEFTHLDGPRSKHWAPPSSSMSLLVVATSVQGRHDSMHLDFNLWRVSFGRAVATKPCSRGLSARLLGCWACYKRKSSLHIVIGITCERKATQHPYVCFAPKWHNVREHIEHPRRQDGNMYASADELLRFPCA